MANIEERVNLFREELNFIRSRRIRMFTKSALGLFPEYFFHIPASSSGRYHPKYALGEGGLVRHTKAAVRIAVRLARMNQFELTSYELDIVTSALILHDGCKSGLKNSGYTKTEHPLICRIFLENNIDDIPDDEILNCIEHHMSQWNLKKSGKPAVYMGYELTDAESKLEKFTALCDYIAAQKFLECNFKVPVIREDI